RYPDNPDMSELRDSFDSELDPGDNYGSRVRGYLYPPVDGDYEFWVSGDDNCELWLGKDADPSTASKICEVPGWTNQHEWTKYPEQKSSFITLQAGKKYYIEGLVKEGGGGDSLTAGWGGPVIGEGPVIIDGAYLSPWLGWFRAHNANPANGAMVHDTWASISWDPGDKAVSHDVYFGDNFEDVSARAESTFLGNQSETDFVVGFPGFPFPDGLVPGTTYYWLIDEINEAEPDSPWKGFVWSFSIPPKTAYNPDPAVGAESINPDGTLRWEPGFGAILHYVYFGDDYDVVNNAAGGLPHGSTIYDPGSLKLAKTYYWRVDAFHGAETYKGEVWSFTTEGAVAVINPANGAMDITQTPTLTWTPGLGASHEVYFGSDAASLELKGSGNLGSESFEPGQLEWDTTYYWHVDEANNANADSPWTGPLWSFTTANFLIIDDMESYNDIEEGQPGSNRIYLAWADGYDSPATNGSVVGNDPPPIAELSIVHGGLQSMPMTYNNAAGKSEATLTLTSNRDWTVNGVDTLTIWFRGESANTTETLYVTLNGSARVDHDDPDAAMKTSWTQWDIPLQAFADQGVNLANVTSITLGLSSGSGGSGKMYFDDIGVYPPTP
ncbi:MAG: PA14 domain-containing protein, partial [Planctomycetota bacterium]